MTRSEKPQQMVGDNAASGQRGAAETYVQYVTRLRGELADLRRDQSLQLSKEWHLALRDRIEAIESELRQLGEKPE
jgi:type VI protein secretion system component VasF